MVAHLGINYSITKGTRCFQATIKWDNKKFIFKDTLPMLSCKLAALPKMFKGSIKVLEGDALTDATKLQKVGHYLAKVGEAISDYTYRPILKLFKDKDAEKVAEAATEASEGVVA